MRAHRAVRLSVTGHTALLVAVAAMVVAATGCRDFRDLTVKVTEASGALQDTAEEVTRFSAQLRMAYRENEQRLQLLGDELDVLAERAAELTQKGTELTEQGAVVAKKLGRVGDEIGEVSRKATQLGATLDRQIEKWSVSLDRLKTFLGWDESDAGGTLNSLVDEKVRPFRRWVGVEGEDGIGFGRSFPDLWDEASQRLVDAVVVGFAAIFMLLLAQGLLLSRRAG